MIIYIQINFFYLVCSVPHMSNYRDVVWRNVWNNLNAEEIFLSVFYYKSILSPKDIIIELGGVQVLALTLTNHVWNAHFRDPLIYRSEAPAVLSGSCSQWLASALPTLCINHTTMCVNYVSMTSCQNHSRTCDDIVTSLNYNINIIKSI